MLMHALMAFVCCVAIWDQLAFDHPQEEDGPMPSAPRPAAFTIRVPNRAQHPWCRNIRTMHPTRMCKCVAVLCNQRTKKGRQKAVLSSLRHWKDPRWVDWVKGQPGTSCQFGFYSVEHCTRHIQTSPRGNLELTSLSRSEQSRTLPFTLPAVQALYVFCFICS